MPENVSSMERCDNPRSLDGSCYNFGYQSAVGKALAAQLAKRGQSFRVVGRTEELLQRNFRLYEPLVEYCAAELSDSAAAERAAAGVDTIFYTVGVPYPQFEQHPKLTRIALA